jgi:magnesium transporter
METHMARKKRKRHYRKASKPGSPPGLLPTEGKSPARLEVLAFTPEHVHAISPANIKQIAEIEERHDVVWINIDGANDADLLLQLAGRYGLHALSLEDVMNTHQRAKFESFESYNFCVLRMFTNRTDSEQLSIFHSGKTVITIQERAGDGLSPLRKRIENKAGHVRLRGSDYLLYAIIDSILDHYFPILEEIEDQLAALDDEIASENTLSMDTVHRLRRELTDVRKWLRPHREMVSQIQRNENNIRPETQVFLKDCHDHVTQLSEGIDHCLENCNILRDYHFNRASSKANEVMKTLTIISTIFIPLSFLAGVFGMNFQHLPGLDWQYGFAILSLVMLTISGGMLAWFYRRGWFR